MIKRCLITLFLLVLLLSIGFVYVTLNTVWVTPWIVHRLIAQSLPQFKVDSIQIAKQKFYFPGQINFQNIQIILKDKADFYTLQVQNFFCDGLDSLWRANSKLSMEIKEGKVESKNIHISTVEGNGHLSLNRGKILTIWGEVKSKGNRFRNYEAQEFFSPIEGDDQKLIFKNFSAQAYGARFKGEISMEYQPSFPYSIQLEFEGLNIHQLKVFNEMLPTQIEGILDGTMVLTGKGNNLETIHVDTRIVEGGKIRASLLGFITQYIPQSRERQHLQELLQDDAKIFVEEASVQIKSLNKNKLTGLMKIASEELNVDLNFPITINLDGKISSLLKYVDQFSFR